MESLLVSMESNAEDSFLRAWVELTREGAELAEGRRPVEAGIEEEEARSCW